MDNTSSFIFAMDANHPDGFARRMTVGDLIAWKRLSNGDDPIIVPAARVRETRVDGVVRYRIVK